MGRESDPGGGGTHSSMFGNASDVVQARDIKGGVHFHSPGGARRIVPRQLPRHDPGFVGRSRDLECLDDKALNGSSTAILIDGAAGVGKTSIAVHWAYRARERFPDGQLYIDLRGYGPGHPVTPLHALDHFLLSLHVTPDAIPPDLDRRAALFRSLIADSRILLILDNATTAEQVRPLLPGVGNSVALITSRNRMSTLIVRDGAFRLTLDVLSEADSVCLLITAMEPARQGDQQTEVAELALLCGGLPLPLRIAAVRAASQPRTPLSELIRDLRDESSLWYTLSSDDDDSDAVSAVFSWSYRALSDEVAHMFRIIGIHPGVDFSCSAAAALAGRSRDRTRRLLNVLVNVHMLENTAHDRYRLHDLLRAYALDQARRRDSPGARRAALERELNWYLHSTISAVTTAQILFPPRVKTPPPTDCDPETFDSEEDAIAWYNAEKSNLLALTRAACASGFNTLARRISISLFPIHHVLRNPYDDWLEMGRLGIEAIGDDQAGKAILLADLGVACSESQRLTEAEDHLDRALALWREAGDLAGEMRSTNTLGWVYLWQRRFDDALTQFAATRSLAVRLSDEQWTAISLINMAMVRHTLGQPEVATELAQRALAVRSPKDLSPRIHFEMLYTLARIHLDLQQYAEAERRLDEANGIAKNIESGGYETSVMLQRGRLCLARRAYDEGLACYERSRVHARRLGDRKGEAEALTGTGQIHQAMHRLDAAVGSYRAAIDIYREVRDPWCEAVTLERLACALADGREADRARTRALSLIDGFHDPPANGLRKRLLNSPH